MKSHAKPPNMMPASQARRGLNRTTLLTVASARIVLLGLALAMGGCSKQGSSWSLKRSEASAQLKTFVADKEAQVKAAARADGQQMLPECQTLFAAAAKGDWPTVHSTFTALWSRRAPQYDHRGTNDDRLTGPQWAAVLETYGAFEAFAGGNDKYCVAFGRDIIASIPAGGIYFGGTDPGRFLVTALCKSQVSGDPFFTVTQNALADGDYLAYLRGMYGDKIYTPTDADSQQCFGDYSADAQRRSEQHQLKPGESFKLVNGKSQISGQVAVMAINGLLAKVIFDKNPDREFFIEESFPLDWMYPHLEPHGLIMKINRQPLFALSEDAMQQDHDYWTHYVEPMIGGWLNANTPVSDVTAFAQKVYLKHDFGGFKGDRRFVQNDYACKMFSKLRSSIAGLYVWRLDHGAAGAERERLVREADFAFRQAFALCPTSPEAVYRYVSFLMGQKRQADALLVASTCLELDPRNNQVAGLVNQLKKAPGAR
jgi:hypothetical protein